MKAIIIAISCLLFSSFTFGQDCLLNIIPRPFSVTCGDGSFRIVKNTKIVAKNEAERKLAAILNDLIARKIGFKLDVTRTEQKKNSIQLRIENMAGHWRSNEEYSLRVSPAQVEISGDEAGGFYAAQTFEQLLPTNGSSNMAVKTLQIQDYPRFRYRGTHLDVSRHFMPVSFVKKFIDLMSQYKFNQFHWHLTDDQGWRIEIKKYPKLTEIGSQRPETMKEKLFSPYVGDGVPHGGFYTQEEIKDVVAYAKARHINVIPEIELPGHASAALAAYPQFGCKPDYKYKVQTTWGIFKEVFCPTDETFKFLEDVLEETIALFPDSPYIHIGGDEVLKDHWKESAFVQELKKRENLKDEHEVQSYTIRRIEKFLNGKGKKMIGWDEILEGGLAPNATVMSWRGMKGGIEAAKSKHDVIMTPTDFAYLDYGQGDPNYEPINIGNHVPLEKVYSFEPVPKELSAEEGKYVIGAQGNIWTEYMKTPDKVEYMAYPRMLALAEVAWSRAEDKNYDDFLRRLAAQLPRLDAQNVNYRIPEPTGLRNVVTENDKVSITLRPFPGTRIHYTTDESTPTEKSPVYEKPIELSRLEEGKAVSLKTISVNAAGRKSNVYAATIMRGKMREPVVLPGEPKPGVNYELTATGKDGNADAAGKTDESRSIMLTQFAQMYDLKKPYVVKFTGFFNAPEDGIYEFQLESTWKAKLTIAGSFVDIDGAADMIRTSISVPLKKGLHLITLQQNHNGGDASLNLRTGIKGLGLRRIYGGELFH